MQNKHIKNRNVMLVMLCLVGNLFYSPSALPDMRRSTSGLSL